MGDWFMWTNFDKPSMTAGSSHPFAKSSGDIYWTSFLSTSPVSNESTTWSTSRSNTRRAWGNPLYQRVFPTIHFILPLDWRSDGWVSIRTSRLDRLCVRSTKMSCAPIERLASTRIPMMAMSIYNLSSIFSLRTAPVIPVSPIVKVGLENRLTGIISVPDGDKRQIESLLDIDKKNETIDQNTWTSWM